MDRRRLRIALVSDVYYPHVGGIQEHIYHLGLEFKKMQHYVKVITGASGDNTAPSGVEVIRIGRIIQIPANKSFSKLTIGYNIGNKLYQLFKREQFDIVHVHGALVPFLPLLSHQLCRSVSVHTFHAAFSKSNGYAIFKKLLSRYMKNIDGLIAVSETARDSIKRYFPNDYVIIPNGVDINRFNPKNRVLDKFRKYSPLILFVGRFEPRKGLKFLFLSFNQLIKKIPNAGLVVVGEGRLKDYYKGFLTKDADKNVFFEGKVSMELLPSYFTTCDIFCSPAYSGESFGIILLESLASGTPVVASDIPGYNNVIKNGYNGILVSAKNPSAITDAVERIIKNNTLRKKLIDNGIASVKQYSWKVISKKVEEFYYRLMEKKYGRESIKV